MGERSSGLFTWVQQDGAPAQCTVHTWLETVQLLYANRRPAAMHET